MPDTPTVDDLTQQALALPRKELNQLLARLLSPADCHPLPSHLEALDWFLPARAYSLVVKTPGVCGGDACIVRTRIPVWTLYRMRQLGVSEGDILKSYPSLRAADLVVAWDYAAEHQQEIEEAIRGNEEG